MRIKSILSNFETVIRNNLWYLSGLLVAATLLLAGSSLVSIPIDGQVKNEVTNSITQAASENEIGLSLNSLEIKPRGNSDYWMYSSNLLQDFQMNNQTDRDYKSYAFAAYEPNEYYSPFRYQNIDCNVLLFESKYKQSSFYFDLPLLAGSLPRVASQNTIYLTDAFATKILAEGQTFSDLIEQEIEASSITAIASDPRIYKIGGIFGTDCAFGKLINSWFGDNTIFAGEYNQYQLNGKLYFCGTIDKDENKSLVEFVFDNYKPLHGSSGKLETGYYLIYRFYTFNIQKSEFELNSTNDRLNKIIDAYQTLPMIFMAIGLVIVALSSVEIIYSTIKNKKILCCGKSYAIFCFWLVSSLSLLISSLFYTFLPTLSLMAKVSFATVSPVTSSVIIVAWIALSISLTLIPFVKRNKAILN